MDIYLLLDWVYQIIWGPILIFLIACIGLYFTIALRGVQFRAFFKAIRISFSSSQENSVGTISHFQTLMTSLAATVGIGNLVGVATAIMAGGFGSIFWMWVMAILGMAIKYVEAFLSGEFRKENDGEVVGGPMYFIEKALGYKKLSIAFAFSGVLATLGGGNMIQANTLVDIMQSGFSIDPLWTVMVLSVIAGITVFAGIRSIARLASWLVPIMAFLYIGSALYVLWIHADKIVDVFLLIVSSAFTEQAAFGGFLGSSVLQAIQVGLARGMMTSEAGLGTASIIAGCSKSKRPTEQGLVAMMSAFLATIVFCTITAMVLGVTGVVGTLSEDGTVLNGGSLTVAAFSGGTVFGEDIVRITCILFGFTTLIGWCYYGEKCVEYIFGKKAIFSYKVLFIAAIITGGLLNLELVWKLSDIFNGCMAITNMIGLSFLASFAVRRNRQYEESAAIEEQASSMQPFAG